jgi:hypothetical protein
VGHGRTNAERQDAMDEATERGLPLRCRERLLAETGYTYTLNWCHDDQPPPTHTRSGKAFWAVPYPQELNDIPMIVARQMDGKDFAQMIVDQLDEMLDQTAATRDAGRVRVATPGAICAHVMGCSAACSGTMADPEPKTPTRHAHPS